MKIIYTLKINCKGKRAVGKINEGINVENIIGLKKFKKRVKKMEEERKKGKKRKTPQNCKTPM